MIGIEKAGEVLGLSPRQVYRRVSSLRPILAPYLKKGENGRLLFDGSGVEILRRAEALRREGYTLRQAFDHIREEMRGKEGGEPGRTIGSDGRLVEVLERENAHLRGEVAFLRARIEEMTPLALPRPRRRWLAWFLPARGRSV